MYLVEIEHSDRNGVQFTNEEFGEAFARYMTEASIHAKMRAVASGFTKINLYEVKGVDKQLLHKLSIVAT